MTNRKLLTRPFSDDLQIKIEGFRGNKDVIVGNRTLWSEIILRKIHCEECEDQDQITFHTRDIPKLIRALNRLMRLQYKKHGKWKKKQRSKRR